MPLPGFIGPTLTCIAPVYAADFHIPEGSCSYVILKPNGEVISNMSIFPRGTTYELKGVIVMDVPTYGLYEIGVDFNDDEMIWEVRSPNFIENIKIRLKIPDENSQGQEHGGDEIAPA